MCGMVNQEKLSSLRDKQGKGLSEAMAEVGMNFNLVNQENVMQRNLNVFLNFI